MSLKVAINGFGRIGRNILRAIIENNYEQIEVVAINDLGPVSTNAHLLKYDTIHGQFLNDVIVHDNSIDVGFGPIKVTSLRNPEDLPWRDLNIDVVFECTGIFASKEKAELHLKAGAKKVLVSAPANGAELTVVYGVNHRKINNFFCYMQ